MDGTEWRKIDYSSEVDVLLLLCSSSSFPFSPKNLGEGKTRFERNSLCVCFQLSAVLVYGVKNTFPYF